MYVRVCVRVSICVYVYVGACVYVYVCACVCTCMYVRVCVGTYVRYCVCLPVCSQQCQSNVCVGVSVCNLVYSYIQR